MTTRRRTATLLAAVLFTAALIAGCSDDPAAEEPGASSSTTTTAPPAGEPPACDPRESYAPLGTPDVNLLRADPKMAEILQRGRLIVGVSSDVTLFGSLNPATGNLEGFDIDMGRQVAEAIFGDADRIQFVVMSFAERIPALQDGTVDLVADIMTMNCERWQVINFSTEYFTAGQQILVVKGSPVQSETDLAGRSACAADRSTSADLIGELVADGVAVEPVIVPDVSDCMVEFQGGTIDAIVGDNTVLAGFAAQDPYAQVVGGDLLTEEPYGLGVAQQNVEFTRFVNAVLEQMRQDGTWAQIYETWLGQPVPPPPPPAYGRGAP